MNYEMFTGKQLKEKLGTYIKVQRGGFLVNLDHAEQVYAKSDRLLNFLYNFLDGQYRDSTFIIKSVLLKDMKEHEEGNNEYNNFEQYFYDLDEALKSIENRIFKLIKDCIHSHNLDLDRYNERKLKFIKREKYERLNYIKAFLTGEPFCKLEDRLGKFVSYDYKDCVESDKGYIRVPTGVFDGNFTIYSVVDDEIVEIKKCDPVSVFYSEKNLEIAIESPDFPKYDMHVKQYIEYDIMTNEYVFTTANKQTFLKREDAVNWLKSQIPEVEAKLIKMKEATK